MHQSTTSIKSSLRERPAPEPSPHRLIDVLRELPPQELQGLASRLRVAIDLTKRVDAPTQLARALLSQDSKQLTLLPSLSRDLLHRVAEAGGTLRLSSAPTSLEPLLARGLLFARRVNANLIELWLPTAILLQLSTWPGEDPRSFRALLSQAPEITWAAIASHYLGRPASPPVLLGLEVAWETLSSPTRLSQELEQLSVAENRLLTALEQVGGDVETEELLDLEREPMRIRSAIGSAPSRRGAAYALEKRGFLIPILPKRFVVPTEVLHLIGREDREERARRRKLIRASVFTADHLPRRARFTEDPTPVALALALLVREPGTDFRSAVGTPRSLVHRLTQRLGREVERVSLLCALSRAIGLWDGSALSAVTPPGSLSAGELSSTLFQAWRRGGAWDEAREEAEVFRFAPEQRDTSPMGPLREIVLQALLDLDESQWVPWSALQGYVESDSHIAGVKHALEKWRTRVDTGALRYERILHRVVFESLHTLGIIDVGDLSPEGEITADTAVRLTNRGRALLSEKSVTSQGTKIESAFIDASTLRIGEPTKIAALLSIAPLVDVLRAGPHLDLNLTNSVLTRALASGIESDVIRRRLEAVAPLTTEIDALLERAGAVVSRTHLSSASGFLWIKEDSVREMLRTRRQTADLFVNPSPTGGLLLQPGIELDKVVRRCRALGVEISQDGVVLRASSSSAMLPAASGVRRKSSSTLRAASDQDD